jgi:hypothetical protein
MVQRGAGGVLGVGSWGEVADTVVGMVNATNTAIRKSLCINGCTPFGVLYYCMYWENLNISLHKYNITYNLCRIHEK